ncbi:hypothetical protein Tco_1065159 [Tanacetum coccineum]
MKDINNVFMHYISINKVDDDQETTKMKEHIEVVPGEDEVAIDVIPLATKLPSIVDFKILKEGNISYFQIIRAGGSSKRYSTFIHMLRSFDKEDLEILWKFVKGRIVRIKRLLDDLRVTAAKITTAGRVYADREEIKDLSEKV